MLSPRSPLAPRNWPTQQSVASKKPTSYGKVTAAADDELLLKAVAANPFSMAELGGPPCMAANAAAPGARALRALGHGHDGLGVATYDPAAGSISLQLLEA